MYSAIYNIPAATKPEDVKPAIEAAFKLWNEANLTNYTVIIPKSGVMPASKTAQGKSIAHFVTDADEPTTGDILSDGGIVNQCWGFQTAHMVTPPTYTYHTETVPKQEATYGDVTYMVSPEKPATYDTLAVMISPEVPATYDDEGNELTPYEPAVYSETETYQVELTPYEPAVYVTVEDVELTPLIPEHDIEVATEVTPPLPEVIVPVKNNIWNNMEDVLDENGDPTGEKVGLHLYNGHIHWVME